MYLPFPIMKHESELQKKRFANHEIPEPPLGFSINYSQKYILTLNNF